MKRLLITFVIIGGYVINSHAGLITHNDYVAGAVITSAGQNTNENTVFNEFNGNIDNTNIKSGANIATTKLQSNILNGVLTTDGSGNIVNSTATLNGSLYITTPYGIVGTSTTVNALPGNIGEYVSSAVSTPVNTGSSGQWKDITTIVLSSGDWSVAGNGFIQNNGATITANNGIALSVNLNNGTADHVDGDNVCYTVAPFAAAGAFVSCSIPGWRVTVSTSTTIHLKSLATFSAGQAAAGGRVSARRVR